MKKGVLKSFTNFTGKHLCLRFFLMKLQAAYKLIKKETMAQMFFCEIYEVFKYTFFTEHLRESTPENVN